MTVLCNTQDGHFDIDLKEVSSLKGQLVEAGGVEPPSENVLTGTSPGADGLLEFPSQSASRHAQRVGSFMMHGALKALRTHGPH